MYSHVKYLSLPSHLPFLAPLTLLSSPLRKHTCQGDYKVAMCVAVAQSCDVNRGEQDFLDQIYPEKHKKLVEQYGGYPWTPDYSPVREIYIPPPRPKTPERPIPLFEQGWDISMPAL